MTITTDGFGNTFVGNFISGTSLDYSELLTAMQTALGSNDRVNANFSIANSRFAWRPNILDETLTGAIPVPIINNIQTNGAGSSPNGNLTANCRCEFSFNSVSGTSAPRTMFLYQSQNFPTYSATINTRLCPAFTSQAKMWAVCREDAVSVFVQEGNNHAFITQGRLVNSPISYPSNISTLTSSSSFGVVNSDAISGAGLEEMAVFGVEANYAHNDGSVTTNEVELYLRRESDKQHLGFLPSILKVKIDGSLVSLTIGEIVNIDFSSAGVGSFYDGQGNRKGIVVARLGNTSASDLTGDYLVMLVAG